MKCIPGELYRITNRVRFYIYPDNQLTWDINTPCSGDLLLFIQYIPNTWEYRGDNGNLKMFLYRDKLLVDSESTASWPNLYLEHFKLNDT